MDNITVKHDVATGLVTITIDTKREEGPSKSGKTIVVATTGGFMRLPNGMSLGLNLVRSR